MRQKQYSPEDLIHDESFQRWVYNPNDQSRQHWESLLAQNPAQRPAVEEAREFLLSMQFSRQVPDSFLDEIQRKMNETIDEVERLKKGQGMATASDSGTELTISSGKSRFRFFYPAAAAVVLLTIVLTYILFTLNQNKYGIFEPFLTETMEIANGTQQEVILSDGTKVWLNAGSKLRYPKNFEDKTTREVYLEGEAFFDVSEDKSKPFIVSTSDIVIKVLGTAFNVKSYPDDKDIETTLVRGKVSIEHSNKQEPVLLTPNEKAVFKKDSQAMTLTKNVNTIDDTAWKDGMIIFDDKPFSSIIQTLQRWYNVQITVEDETSLNCTFSGKFKDKTIEEVLEIVKATESVDYSIDNKQIRIYGKLCE